MDFKARMQRGEYIPKSDHYLPDFDGFANTKERMRSASPPPGRFCPSGSFASSPVFTVRGMRVSPVLSFRLWTWSGRRFSIFVGVADLILSGDRRTLNRFSG
ncbi:unnamed protein product [Cuscuta epithymum]|uniref:Uncharacterized protein n=1 Tax=Cuscuta epithymum TaxID=186058 RepID=A0AAV0EDM0_9ASTE|nr:unnamed protein product [Cuscuta epithymum]